MCRHAMLWAQPMTVPQAMGKLETNLLVRRPRRHGMTLNLPVDLRSVPSNPRHNLSGNVASQYKPE